MATATKDAAKGPGRAARAANAKDPAPPKRADEARWAADLLKMVADPTRLAIVGLLAARDHYVGELTEALGQSQPAVSHHLCILRLGGVVEVRRDGKHNYYSISVKGKALAAAVRPLVGG